MNGLSCDSPKGAWWNEIFKQNEMENNNIGKAVYGIISNGKFGVNIVSGIVTGVSYTEDKPIYEISFGRDKWRTKEITETKEELLDMLCLASLDRVKESHGLKIRYNT